MVELDALPQLLADIGATQRMRLFDEVGWEEARKQLVVVDGPAMLDGVLPNTTPIGRIGVGTQAEIPWISVFDDRQTSATEGCYAVYLFDAVGEFVFLCIGLGTENARLSELDELVEGSRRFLGDKLEGLSTEIDLQSSQAGGRPLRYERGTVGCIPYELSALPPPEKLLRDLQRAVALARLLTDVLPKPRRGQTRVAGVYVGNDGAVNLQVGLDAGTWGWTDHYAEPAKLQPGDLFLLAFGGGGRLKVEDWVERTAREIHVCQVTRPMYEDSTPLWPDEGPDQSYPHRVGVELLGSVTDFEYGRLPLEVNKLFQTSATKQGRAFVSEVDSFDEILANLGVGEVPTAVVEPEGSKADVAAQFAAALKAANVDYGGRHDQLVRRFVASLAAKRFLILTGLSGSGKTKIAQAFGEWLGEGHSEIVPVRPDWTSPDYLLGYQNELGQLTDGGAKPWVVPETLKLILRAVADPARPYLLILDEMNLAHVERYFADVLSGIESNEPVIPNVVNGAQDAGEPLVRLPDNLFVVGTVNVDETTYMFSPKVLDRANTIEFRVETGDLGRTNKRPTRLEVGEAGFVTRFLADSTKPLEHDGVALFADWIREVHGLLSKSGREFGHRSYAEMMEFREHFMAAGGAELEAFDAQMYQKVLPRIHGSQRDVGDTLHALAAFCFYGPGITPPDEWKLDDARAVDAQLPLSFDKTLRMWRRLQDTHFVSFAE